jgi:hypothetical protein
MKFGNNSRQKHGFRDIAMNIGTSNHGNVDYGSISLHMDRLLNTKYEVRGNIRNAVIVRFRIFLECRLCTITHYIHFILLFFWP